MTINKFLDRETIKKINKISRNKHNIHYNGNINVSALSYREHIGILFTVIDVLIMKLGDRMGLGMLWNFGKGSKKTVEEHIGEALDTYNVRHEPSMGVANKCHINPFHVRKLEVKGEKLVISGLDIVSDKTIARYNLWIK